MSSTTTIDLERAKESNTAMILAVTGTFHVLALVFVALRTYTRAIIVKTIGIDDYMMIASALCALGGGMVIFIIQAFYGLGRHKDTISKPDQVFFSKVGFFQSIISAIAALAFLKISIALSLLRLSKNRWYSRALWALIVFVVLYTILAWLSFFLYCTPLEGYWNKSLKPTCYNLKLFVNFALVNTAFNIFTDVCFATLPIPIIWVLQMKLRTRIYLIGVLSLGYLAVIMGIVKAVYQIAQPGNRDGTFHQSIQFWGFLQLNLGIIAACAPAIKPLIGRALKITSSRRYNSDNLYENRYPTGRTGRTVNITANAKRQGYREQGSQGAPDFELEERAFSQSAEYYRTSIKGGNHPAAVAVYQKNSGFGDRSGSEEMILDADNKFGENRGIMRTTEVHVQR
ncbi:integral membrane protein [Colletotrichum incanum]|uniref:Integral membrane protein n=1 Tax=Colletotrichum incanum TaxID=1573173 RepID=A0A166TV23_COLIC|nr:integral membrane protein [Colletotrichum incanum]OHW98057.1 integral membrane protein [Colletotrichum incanum]